MKEANIKKLKDKLEKKKKEIEAKLRQIADKDPKIKGDWDLKFPKFNGKAGGGSLEEAADEVEEYVNLKPIEHSLELRLQEVNQALDKITQNRYGLCEGCQKPISLLRLKISPEAKCCLRCKKAK